MQNKTMSITTDAIGEDGAIDARYTCDLDNSSPELRWSDPPPNTHGFALLTEDIDVPNEIFSHWVIYNIPREVRHLPAGIPPQESLPNGIRQGINSFGKLGYSGPCPPAGDRPHRYRFRIYALSALPKILPRPQRDKLLEAIFPYSLETAEILGKYQRAIQRAG